MKYFAGRCARHIIFFYEYHFFRTFVTGDLPFAAIFNHIFGYISGSETILFHNNGRYFFAPCFVGQPDYGTIQGLLAENYIPVFADTVPGTVNMGPETIEPCISDRTRAILTVHKTGLVNDMDPINALAAKHDLIVYEDSCQAVFNVPQNCMAVSRRSR